MRHEDKISEPTYEWLREWLFYDEETGELRWAKATGQRYAWDIADRLAFTGYRYVTIRSKRYASHRVAYFWMTGAWPINQIDHINHVRDDNRWVNLRDATASQNVANVRCHTYKYKGVIAANRGYRAIIRARGTSYSLGLYQNAEQAFGAYKIAAKFFHGEYACVEPHPDVAHLDPPPKPDPWIAALIPNYNQPHDFIVDKNDRLPPALKQELTTYYRSIPDGRRRQRVQKTDHDHAL